MHVINYDMPSSDHGGIHEYVHRIGRTARIGNMGFSTSLYNDRNEDIAEALVRILIESGSDVPDFLEQFKPADEGELAFDDDTDEEIEGGGGDNAKESNGGEGWGAGADNQSEGGWN